MRMLIVLKLQKYLIFFIPILNRLIYVYTSMNYMLPISTTNNIGLATQGEKIDKTCYAAYLIRVPLRQR